MPKETMKLLKSTEKVVAKNKYNESVPKLGFVDVILMHCNVFNNNCQQVFMFVPDKQFGQLITIAPIH